MLTIACVYKPGRGFKNHYVYRLRDSVRQFCRVPHKFVCLTNEPLADISCARLNNGWSGFWNKLELFRKGLFDGPVWYFDLDTMFTDYIDDMVVKEFRFASLTNWFRPKQMASGVMAWDGRLDFSHIPAAFKPLMVERYQREEKFGDQAFIQECVGPYTSLNEVFPGRIVSYKWHVRPVAAVPAGASVVCFHGRPRPADIEWRLPDVA